MPPGRLPPVERALLKGAAIVLPLAAVAYLLWPVFPDRAMPARTACLSNMKSLAIGLLIYSGDSDDALPLAPPVPKARPTALGWAGRILPYVKSPAVFRDPEERDAPIGYALNANVAEAPKTTAVPAPERAVLLFEVARARLAPAGEAARPA